MHSEWKGLKCLHRNKGDEAMQKMWTEIDAYIDSHLIPEDPILLQTLKHRRKRFSRSPCSRSQSGYATANAHSDEQV